MQPYGFIKKENTHHFKENALKTPVRCLMVKYKVKRNSKKNINVPLHCTLAQIAEVIHIHDSSKSIFFLSIDVLIKRVVVTHKTRLIRTFLYLEETLGVVHGALQYRREPILVNGVNRKTSSTHIYTILDYADNILYVNDHNTSVMFDFNIVMFLYQNIYKL